MTVRLNLTNKRAEKLKEALDIVHELASQNTLNEHEIGPHEITLQREYDRQIRCLHEVELFIEELDQLC